MNEVVALFGQAQKRFMAAYKEVNQIISHRPGGDGFPEEMDAPEEAGMEVPAAGDVPDMQDDLTDADIEKMFALDD